MQDCLFCRIVNKAPVHVLVIPKAHYENLAAAAHSDAALVGRVMAALTRIARDLGLEETGHRVVVNTGEDGYQTVQHLHFHLLGKRRLGWPPG